MLSGLARACDQLKPLGKPLPAPRSLPVAKRAPQVSGTLDAAADLRLVEMPVRPDGSVVDWASSIRAAWDISESAALALTEQFLSEGALMSLPFFAR
jgi:hypothetical protein